MPSSSRGRCYSYWEGHSCGTKDPQHHAARATSSRACRLSGQQSPLVRAETAAEHICLCEMSHSLQMAPLCKPWLPLTSRYIQGFCLPFPSYTHLHLLCSLLLCKGTAAGKDAPPHTSGPTHRGCAPCWWPHTTITSHRLALLYYHRDDSSRQLCRRADVLVPPLNTSQQLNHSINSVASHGAVIFLLKLDHRFTVRCQITTSL